MIGACEACEQVAEVEQEQFIVRLDDASPWPWHDDPTGGKRQKFKTFACRLCADCRRKVFPDKFNTFKFFVGGLVAGLLPLLSDVRVEWLIGSYAQGWLWTILKVGLLLASFACMLGSVYCEMELLDKVPEYYELATDGYSLVHRKRGHFIQLWLLSATVTLSALWCAMSYIRSRQDAWMATRGVVTSCHVKTTATGHLDRRRPTQYFLCAKFTYEYAWDGKSFRGLGYRREKIDEVRAEPLNPWKTGAEIKVLVDPLCPDQSAVAKCDPRYVGVWATIGGVLSVLLLLCRLAMRIFPRFAELLYKVG